VTLGEVCPHGPHGPLSRACEVCELTDACHGWALAEVERDAARALLEKVRTGEHFSEHTPGNCSVCSDIDKALSEGRGEA